MAEVKGNIVVVEGAYVEGTSLIFVTGAEIDGTTLVLSEENEDE